MSKSPHLQEFTDFREFLLAHADAMKASHPRWSYGHWTKRLGLKSTSSLTKILQGKRTPGKQMTHLFVKYFKFTNDEAEYFRRLVLLEKMKDDLSLRFMVLDRLKKLRSDDLPRVLDSTLLNIVGSWYVLPLIEMTKLKSFVEDADWISKSYLFPVLPELVSRAVDDLLAVSLLKRDTKGRLVLCESKRRTTEDTPLEAIKRFHEQMLENAKLAIRMVSPEDREFSSSTIVVRKTDLPQAKEFIREMRKEFVRRFEADDGEELYQIQFQYFPLTQVSKGR